MGSKKIAIIFTLVLFGVIIFLSPALHKETYLVINNDTAAHLSMFEAMKNGSTDSLYLGQTITGYALIWLEKVTGVSLQTSFMWFNFAALFFSGVSVAVMVTFITKNKLAGALSALIIVFGIGSTMHLFYSGTIFNVIEVLIILPVLLVLVYIAVKSRKVKWVFVIVPVAVLAFFFHPSLGEGILRPLENVQTLENVISPITTLALFFGISNLAILVICAIGFITRKNKEKIGIELKVTFAILLTLVIGLAVLAFSGVTPFSSRLAINFCLVLGIFLCLFIGITLRNNQTKVVLASVVSLALVGIVPNLIIWLSFPSYRGGLLSV